MPPGVSEKRRFGEGGGGWRDVGEDVIDMSGSLGDGLDEFEGEGRWVEGWPSSAKARALPVSVII